MPVHFLVAQRHQQVVCNKLNVLAHELVCIPSLRLMNSLENVRPGIRPCFFSQKMVAKEPAKKMPLMAANATKCSPKVEHFFVDVRLVNLGVPEGLLDGLERAAEQVRAQLLETGTSEGSVEVMPPKRESISMEVWVADDRVRLTHSQAVLRRQSAARGLEERSASTRLA
jgi:hypothetical protein